MPDVIAGYLNGGYSVSIETDGTKTRRTIDPSIPPVHPEHMDLKITDWCDAGCSWCHEGSTRRGRHGDIDEILRLLSDLPAGVEIAIGGGDPLSHPGFIDLVRGLRSFGLIPSVTVNGRHFERHRSTLDLLVADGVLFGVGVSFAGAFPKWDHPHMVIHMIAGIDDPRLLLDADRRKVLLLGYKTWGRGQRLVERRGPRIEARVSDWYRLLPLIVRRHHVSFDTLAIEQMKPSRMFLKPQDYARRFMGAEGSFGLYVDAVTRTYALSSYSPERKAWTSILEMFRDVRLASDRAQAA